MNLVSNKLALSREVETLHRLGISETELQTIIGAFSTKIVEASLPALKTAVAEASVAAEPTIQKVVREEVMPKVTLAVVVGMIGLAGVSSLIGAFFASRSGSGRKGMAGISMGSVSAAGDGPSSISHLTEGHMTQKSVVSPPMRARAANGNLVHELRASARELADELARKRSGNSLAGPVGYGYRPGFVQNPSAGLGLSRLVNGIPNPGAIIVGAAVGVPVQQLASRVLLQQALGAKEMVGDGVTGLAGVLLHLAFRSSFTLGFGTSLLLPFVADITDWVFRQVGLVKGLPASMGARNIVPNSLRNRGAGQVVNDIRRVA